MAKYENFRKVTIAQEDLPAFQSLKRKLTIRAEGTPVTDAAAIRWLLDQPEAQQVLREGK